MKTNQRIYMSKDKFIQDPAVKKFTAALREFSESIAFTTLHIEHVIETVETKFTDCFGNTLTDTLITGDYFVLDITQGREYLSFTLEDITLPERAPIYLSKCEFDMLETNDQRVGKKFGDFKTYINMQNAGWFKDVPADMYIDDIIKHCKIKED